MQFNLAWEELTCLVASTSWSSFPSQQWYIMTFTSHLIAGRPLYLPFPLLIIYMTTQIWQTSENTYVLFRCIRCPTNLATTCSTYLHTTPAFDTDVQTLMSYKLFDPLTHRGSHSLSCTYWVSILSGWWTQHTCWYSAYITEPFACLVQYVHCTSAY